MLTDHILRSRAQVGRSIAAVFGQELWPMPIVSAGRVVMTTPRGEADAALIDDYRHAVRVFLETGDAIVLDSFAGQSVCGHVLDTDPDHLVALALAGTATKVVEAR